MWVYEQPARAESAAPAKALPEAKARPAEPETPVQDKAPQQPKAALSKPDKPRRGGGQAAKECLFLAAAYLLGTAAAGALQALCDTGEREALSYYLGRWCALFAPDGAQSAVRLFGCEYAAAAGAFTVLLFLGLSALGPLPVYLFVMLYGTGCGLLASQLFNGLTPKVLLAYIAAAGVPLAVAAACVCVFGASAVSVCARLRAFSFGQRAEALGGTGARGLVGQYVLFVVSLAPVCGAATALAYAANRLQIW